MTTDADIVELKNAAAAAGDDLTWCTCVIALEGEIESFEERFGGGGFSLPQSARVELETMSQREARARCARHVEDKR